MIVSDSSDQYPDMSSQTWVFSNHEDGAKIRFKGDVVAARAFLQVLKTHCHGQWGLLGESPGIRADSVANPSKLASAPVAAMPSDEMKPAESKAQESEPVPAPIVVQSSLPASDLQNLPNAPSVQEPQELPGLSEPEVAPDAGGIVAPVASVGEAAPAAPVVASIEQRKSVRYNFPFRVILTAEGKSFRSQSHDISIGGMKLKHRPPEEMWNQACHVFIGSPFAAENIELKCRLFPDPKSPLRVRFVDASESSLKKLEQWILAADKASKKKAA